jgi:Na+-translocating ferredoxin:NAD+ oxidoreductase RnfC subunit
MPFRGTFDDVDRVVLKLKQHVGAPASALVAVGDSVTVGQRIADMRDGALGAAIHASISGRVAKVDDRAIVIRRV